MELKRRDRHIYVHTLHVLVHTHTHRSYFYGIVICGVCVCELEFECSEALRVANDSTEAVAAYSGKM